MDRLPPSDPGPEQHYVDLGHPAGETATVTHPEHAHMVLGPGCWQVTHQMDARSRERVQD